MSFHIRRKDREITDPQLLKRILKTANYITIALSMDNEPYLISLTHGYDQERNCIYFHCAPEGKKIVYLNSNPRIWGQAVIDYDVTSECAYSYASVHFSGNVSILDDLEEKQRAIETMVRQLTANPESKLAKISREALSKTTFGRIDITYITGKRHEKTKV